MPGYVSCEAKNCIHCGQDEELYLLCMAPVIELCGDDDGPFVCSSYKDYHELEDYHEPFFKAVKTEDGPGRLTCKGKRIEINGHIFYTDSHPRDVEDGYATLTHGPSGMYAGSIASIKERWAQFGEVLKRGYTPVEQLLPVEPMEAKKGKDGHVYRYRLVQQEASDG